QPGSAGQVPADRARWTPISQKGRSRGSAQTVWLCGGLGGNLRPNELIETAGAADEYPKPRTWLFSAQFQPRGSHRRFAGLAHRAIGKDCLLRSHKTAPDEFSTLSLPYAPKPIWFRGFRSEARSRCDVWFPS